MKLERSMLEVEIVERAFKPECLSLRLKKLEAEYNDAVWDENDERVKNLKEEIEITKTKLSMGETHDWPF
jgi:hypothetical protein